MPDAYRTSEPEIACRRHPEVAAVTSCTRCGHLLCDACRVFAGGRQICAACRSRSRYSTATFVWTFAGVAAFLCVFAALTKRSLAERSTPSPVTSTLDSPAMAFSLEGPKVRSDVPTCVGDDCFYPLRVIY